MTSKFPRAAALQSEGSLWRAASLLAAAGQLRTALLTLRAAGLADAAVGFTAVCREAGFAGAQPAADPREGAAGAAASVLALGSSKLEDLYPHGNGSSQSRRPPAGPAGDAGGGSAGHLGQAGDITEGDHLQYVMRLLQSL